MIYDDFLEIVKKHTMICPESCFDSYCDKDPTNICFFEKEDVGGVSGGSCWESSDPEPYTRQEGYEEAKRCFEEKFDEILMDLCPNISFLQYKNIYNKCVKSTTTTSYEYYGNSTVYYILYCTVKNLYDILMDMNLI